MLDLRTADVRKGVMKDDSNRLFFQISHKKKEAGTDVVCVTFETKEEFNRWGLVFLESMKSDESLMANKQSEIDRQQEEQRKIDEQQELQSRRHSVVSQIKNLKQ